MSGSNSNSRSRAGGYRFLAARPGAAQYQPDTEKTVPPKVDLRKHLTPVEDQGPLNSCTANAIAGAYEYLIKKHKQSHVDVSRLFIYYNARWRDKSQDEDDGSYIQYGMESLQKFGACVEQTWPYRKEAVLEKPSRESYAEASKFRVLDMQQVGLELDHWRTCLADGYPIVFGCVLFDSFDESGEGNGRVPMPDPKAVARGSHSRHAMLCVGYSDIDKVFIVRNSWGSRWGDNGYCYMPYTYLMSRKFNLGDCWILRSAEQLPSPDDTWVDDEESIVPGDVVEAETEYDDDAYEDFEVTYDDEDVEWEEVDDEEYDETDEDGTYLDDEEEADEEDETSEDDEEETSEDDEETEDDGSEDEDSEEETEEEEDEEEEDDSEEEETEDDEESEDEEEESDEEDDDSEEEEEDSEEEDDSEEEEDDEGEEEDEEA